MDLLASGPHPFPQYCSLHFLSLKTFIRVLPSAIPVHSQLACLCAISFLFLPCFFPCLLYSRLADKIKSCNLLIKCIWDSFAIISFDLSVCSRVPRCCAFTGVFLLVGSGTGIIDCHKIIRLVNMKWPSYSNHFPGLFQVL